MIILYLYQSSDLSYLVSFYINSIECLNSKELSRLPEARGVTLQSISWWIPDLIRLTVVKMYPGKRASRRLCLWALSEFMWLVEKGAAHPSLPTTEKPKDPLSRSIDLRCDPAMTHGKHSQREKGGTASSINTTSEKEKAYRKFPNLQIQEEK